MSDRAMRSTRAILFSKGGGTALNYLEAVELEPREDVRERMVVDVGRRIAEDPDPAGAAREVVAAFLARPPRGDDVPDKAPRPSEVMRRRRNFMEHEVVAGQGQPFPVDDGEVGPREVRGDDGRRGLDEVLRAAKALGFATRMNGDAALATVVRRAAGKVADFGRRMGGDSTSAAALRSAAADMLVAVSAAGTMPLGAEQREEREVVDQAMRKSDDPDRAVELVREWRALRDSGHTRLSRDRYLEVNARRLGR